MGSGAGAVCMCNWGERGVIDNFFPWGQDLVQCVCVTGVKGNFFLWGQELVQCVCVTGVKKE